MSFCLHFIPAKIWEWLATPRRGVVDFVGFTVVWAVPGIGNSQLYEIAQWSWYRWSNGLRKEPGTHLQKPIFGTFSITWSLWWSNFDGKSEWTTVNHAESLKFMFYMTACNASMAPNVKPMQVASPLALRAGWWQQCCPGRLPDNYIDHHRPIQFFLMGCYIKRIFNDMNLKILYNC